MDVIECKRSYAHIGFPDGSEKMMSVGQLAPSGEIHDSNPQLINTGTQHTILSERTETGDTDYLRSSSHAI